VDSRLTKLPQVVATPHIAASTVEAQEQVGIETAAALRSFLADGIITNAVNFPTIPGEAYTAIRPFMALADRLGALVSQLATGRTHAIGIRYYGPLVGTNTELLASSVVAGVLRPMLSGTVTVVNARSIAGERGIDIVETRSSRPRDFINLLSVKLHTTEGEHWVEGTVFEPDRPRLLLVDGVDVEAPLEHTLVLISNDDQPGVIGEVGTILGRHGINIANFALGRRSGGAIGVVNVDAEGQDETLGQAVDELRRVRAIRDVKVVRV
jgi:D-3-phosphoglycerate dehydrogenase